MPLMTDDDAGLIEWEAVATPAFAVGKFGTGIYGGGGGLRSKPGQDLSFLNFSTDIDFTVEFFAKHHTISTIGYQILLASGERPAGSATGEYGAVQICCQSGAASTIKYIYVLVGLANTQIQVSTTSQITASAFSHIVVQRRSGLIELYIDGVVRGSLTNPLACFDFSLSGLRLLNGDTASSTGRTFVTLDELRIVRGKALYSGTFAPPTAPFNINDPV